MRPTGQPHHTASAVALVGGGSPPRPGEISLAHQGVLFLDELPEFPRAALEALREPLETGHITIARAAQRAEFPARFQMIAAMNPCPCGFLGSTQRACRCTPDQVHRYQAKLSGPLLDRIDLHVEVPALPAEQLVHDEIGAKLVANTAYALNQIIHPAIPNGYRYRCTLAGNSGATLPAEPWPTAAVLTAGAAQFTPEPVFEPKAHGPLLPVLFNVLTEQPV